MSDFNQEFNQFMGGKNPSTFLHTNLPKKTTPNSIKKTPTPLNTPPTDLKGQALNLATNLIKEPIVGESIKFVKNVAKQGIETGKEYIKSIQKHPKETAIGAVEGSSVAITKFGAEVAKLIQDGYKNSTVVGISNFGVHPTIPERWDMEKQLPAFNKLVELKLKEKSIPEQHGFAIGNFIGSFLPYALASEITGATVGSKILLPTAEKFLPQAVKFIPKINDAIGFLGIGQLEYDKSIDESRVNKVKNDLIMLALFEAGGTLVKSISKNTKRIISKVINTTSKDIKGNGADLNIIEQSIKEAKDAIKKDTGRNAEVILADNIVKTSKTELLNEPIQLKTSGVAEQIEAEAVEKGMLNKGYNELAQYDSSTIKAQSQEASKYTIDDMNKIATGEIPLPKELKPGTPLSIAEDFAIKNNDVELIRKLANSPLVSQISESASELSLSRMRDTNSPVKIIKDLINKREKDFKIKYVNKSSTEIINKTVKDIQKKIKIPDKYDWNNFVKSLEC